LSLQLLFRDIAPETISRGPYTSFRIEGVGLIRPDLGGPVIAEHRDQAWLVNGGKYYRLDCEGPVTVRFEGGSEDDASTYGPYEHFSCVGGAAYVDRAIFGHIETQTGRWHCLRDGRDWAALVVARALATE
jgi:hypothetical protein